MVVRLTRGAAPLTDEQKSIIRKNPNLYAATIMTLPGMEGTTKRQIETYQRKPHEVNAQCLADALERYIGDNGLPQPYSSGVIGYIRYLRTR